MLLTSKSKRSKILQFIDRHRPHLEEASGLHPASPFGIAQAGLGRRWRLVGQGQERQQIPITPISICTS